MIRRAYPQVLASGSAVNPQQQSVVLLSFLVVIHHHSKDQFTFIQFSFIIPGQKNKPIISVDGSVILLDLI